MPQVNSHTYSKTAIHFIALSPSFQFNLVNMTTEIYMEKRNI